MRFDLKIGLDLQDAYDQARAMEYMWAAAAETLADDHTVCDHPPRLQRPADGELPALCSGCDRIVPLWALRRDRTIEREGE